MGRVVTIQQELSMVSFGPIKTHWTADPGINDLNEGYLITSKTQLSTDFLSHLLYPFLAHKPQLGLMQLSKIHNLFIPLDDCPCGLMIWVFLSQDSPPWAVVHEIGSQHLFREEAKWKKGKSWLGCKHSASPISFRAIQLPDLHFSLSKIKACS